MSKVSPDQIEAKLRDAEQHGGELDLHQCSLDAECARQLSLVLETSTLERLILSSNEIGDPGCAYLGPAMSNNLKLHRLVLMGNMIGDEGAKSLADGLITNHHLRDLDLHDNAITEVGAVHVARLLRYSHHLEHLLVGSNKIGDKGVRVMCAAIKKNHRGKLHTLGLSSNGLTDASCVKLYHLVDKYEHTLTKVELGSNDIDDYATMDKIKASCKKNSEYITLKSWQHDVHQKQRGEKKVGTGTVDQLTAAQKKEINDAFALYDKDGSGMIDAAELTEVMKECHHGEEPDPELVAAMIEDADDNGSGQIGKPEFMSMMARQMAGSDSESDSSSSDEDESSDEEVLREFGLLAKTPGGAVSAKSPRGAVPEGTPPAGKAAACGGAEAANKWGHVWEGDDHMHECGDCGQMVFLWCRECEACKTCDDRGKGHACGTGFHDKIDSADADGDGIITQEERDGWNAKQAAPQTAAGLLNRARTNQAEDAEIDALADLDDLEALDLGAAPTTAVENPLAAAQQAKEDAAAKAVELKARAAKAVPLLKGDAKKAAKQSGEDLTEQRERVKNRMAAAKAAKAEEAAAAAAAKKGGKKGGKRGNGKPAPAPAPAPGVDPGVARHMANLE